MYTPEAWVVVQLSPDLHKVFAGWRGGFATGDSWKLNSGIEKTEETDDAYLFHGFSGSVYKCYKKLESEAKLGAYNGAVLGKLLAKDPSYKIIHAKELV